MKKTCIYCGKTKDATKFKLATFMCRVCELRSQAWRNKRLRGGKP